ncbi:MAG TPA: hypothetical protein PKN33_14835 [Phycisphaerae bacterium]|nr:hypothetical protein [Phycisphaerales bacterium]HNO79323.1 hypothetical protein [Phycisphaerae bacterium]
MNEYANYASKLFEVFRQHLPSEVMATQFPAAIVAIVIGVGVCVLGAKLARWLITIIFASAGMVCGLGLGKALGFSSPISALGGGLALGGVGFSLYRFWVGLMAGAFLSAVALGIVSSQLAFPHLSEFDELQRSSHSAEEVRDFQPGPSDNVLESGWDKLEAYGKRFWDYLNQQESSIRLQTVGWGVGAGLVGMLMGLLLSRITLIVFTAAFGTILISGGIYVLGNRMGMDMLQATRERPAMSGLAILSFFIVSIALQTALTRKEAPASE